LKGTESSVEFDERFLIRSYRSGDEESINRLFNEIFGQNRELDEWRWKFLRNPAGFLPDLIVLGEHNGRVVGQYANLPRRFSYRGRIVTACQVVDNFMGPADRGRIRRLRRMFQRVAENAKREGCAIVFGFPMPRNTKLGKRILKWFDVGAVKPLFRRLNWASAIRRRSPQMPGWALNAVRHSTASVTRLSLTLSRSYARGHIKIETVEAFDERFDRLWSEKKHDFVLIGARDREHLTWRFVDSPHARYEILTGVGEGDRLKGYVVLLEREEGGAKVGYVVDTLYDDSETLDCLIRKALSIFAARHVDYVLCWLTPGETEQRLRERWGFSTRADFQAIPIVYHYPILGTIRDEDAANAANWYLTYADLDTI
jgi:hypothetical protein